MAVYDYDIFRSDAKRFIVSFLAGQKGNIATLTWKKISKRLHIDGRGWTYYKKLLRHIILNEMREVKLDGCTWKLANIKKRGLPSRTTLCYIYKKTKNMSSI